VSPEGIEHLVGYYTGGLGATVMQSVNMGKALAGDPSFRGLDDAKQLAAKLK